MCHARQSTIGDPEGQSETAVRRAIPAAVAAAAVDRFTDSAGGTAGKGVEAPAGT